MDAAHIRCRGSEIYVGFNIIETKGLLYQYFYSQIIKF